MRGWVLGNELNEATDARMNENRKVYTRLSISLLGMNHIKIIFLITLCLLVLSGCKNGCISEERHQELLSIENQYSFLQQKYYGLEKRCTTQITQCNTQLQNVTNILHDELDYKGPIEIKIPLSDIKHTLTYPEAGEAVQVSFWIALGTLIVDLLVGFFFINIMSANKVRKFVFGLTLLGLAVIIVYILSIFF